MRKRGNSPDPTTGNASTAAVTRFGCGLTSKHLLEILQKTLGPRSGRRPFSPISVWGTMKHGEVPQVVDSTARLIRFA